jgi:dihydrodipicolinate synthase/N-acetylneuraminate lyase
MEELNEKAIAHDVRKSAEQGFVGISIITEAGTTPSETKELTEIVARHARGRILTSLLTTFPTLNENIEMVRYARSVGIDMIQLGYPAMWCPNSLSDVVEYTRRVCEASSLPTLLWAADMWGWCQLLQDSNDYPKELLLEFARIPNIVAIKGGTAKAAVLREIYSRGIIPGTVKEPLFPFWIKNFGARWGGISVYNHFYFAPTYFLMLRQGHWKQGMNLYSRMKPIRTIWSETMKAEVGSEETSWGWTGHNRLRWKYVGWLAGLSGGPVRGWFRITPGEMRKLRVAMLASKIPVTRDEDVRFFAGRFPS